MASTGHRPRFRLLLALGVLSAGAGLAPAVAQQVGPRDNPDGSPRAGLDPAQQPAPTSLTRAAQRARPSDVQDPGVNSGSVPLASGVRGSERRVAPSEVLSDVSARGGCAKGYGDPGQCLPARPPSRAGHAHPAPWTCADVRRVLPRGIAVRGADVLRLDGNRDGVACGRGDA